VILAVSIRGTVDAAGNGLEALAGLKFGANGAFGTLTSVKNVETFDLVGTSDATKASAGSEDAEFLKLFKDTTWGFAGTPDLLNEKASDFANGFAAFSVTIGSKGKAKIAGVMPNGTKVTVTSKMIVGDKKFAIPVAFSKSDEAFGFVIWVDFEGKIIELADATEWTGKDGARQSFVQKWGGESHFGDPLAETVEPIVRVSAADLPTGLADALAEFLPIYEEFTSADGKWTFKKTPKIKFTKGVFDQEAYDKDIAKGKTNNSGVKLTLTKKNGTFKGTFQVYTLTDKGSVKKNKATVNGIMVNGIGYGSAVIKKFGAMPVLIGHDKLAVEEIVGA